MVEVGEVGPGVHGRLNPARVQGIDPDAERAEFLRGAARIGGVGRLAAGVRKKALAAGHRGDRGYEDDDSPAGGAHPRDAR